MTRPSGDSGVAQERTELAWRRTLLAFAVGSLIAMRVLGPVLGAWSIVVGSVGVAWTGALWAAAARRRGRSARRTARPGGLLLAAAAASTSVGALLGLLSLWTGAVR